MNSFVLRSIFRNFEASTSKLLHLGIKKNEFFCSALDFSNFETTSRNHSRSGIKIKK